MKMMKTLTFLTTQIFQKLRSSCWLMHFLEIYLSLKTMLRQFNWCIYFFLKVKQAKVTYRMPYTVYLSQQCKLYPWNNFSFWLNLRNQTFWEYLEPTARVNIKTFFVVVIKQNFSLMQSKPVCNRPHYQALVIIFFVSLDIPELVECAKKLANKETFVKDCFYMSWCLSLGKTFERVPEYSKMAAFLRQHCERKNWNITEWLKIQSKSSNH